MSSTVYILQSRLTALLEEERRARREESALGEAVLREVRETQGLLGEVSSSSTPTPTPTPNPNPTPSLHSLPTSIPNANPTPLLHPLSRPIPFPGLFPAISHPFKSRSCHGPCSFLHGFCVDGSWFWRREAGGVDAQKEPSRPVDYFSSKTPEKMESRLSAPKDRLLCRRGRTLHNPRKKARFQHQWFALLDDKMFLRNSLRW